MFGLDQFLAWAILAAPPAWIDPLIGPQSFFVIRPALQAAAVRMEILDPREVQYILARPEDFLSDLNLLRRRYDDLIDAPPLCDGLRFPDAETVNQLLTFNRQYRQHLHMRQPVELPRHGELKAAVLETDDLYHVWDTIRDARSDYYYVTVRRQALKKLRDILGAESYYFGRLPPPVPLWRFREID